MITECNCGETFCGESQVEYALNCKGCRRYLNDTAYQNRTVSVIIDNEICFKLRRSGTMGILSKGEVTEQNCYEIVS